LKFEPNNPNAHFDLGNSYFRLQRYDQAVASYSTSVNLQPDFWPALNNIGLVLYEQGKTAEALDKWQAASQLVNNQEPEPKLAKAVALYHQEACGLAANVRRDRCQEAFSLGVEALEQDSRYTDPSFLELNLWGPHLVSSTQQFFESPIMKRLLGEL
jgi:tetratricopeptide (TPR) repeat protein